MRLDDLTGQRFGLLTVAARTQNDSRGRAKWLCRCDCGGERTSAGYSLKAGDVLSCGCIRSEAMRRTAAERHKGSPFQKHRDKYATWRNMISRCHNPDDKQFALYGGKGVVVCEAWKTFAGFVVWAKDKPDGMTLDRIDPAGPYTPENCRWADQLTQQNNRRRHVWIEHNGERLTATQLARRLGVTPWKIYNGIKDRGDPLWYVRDMV